MDFEYGGAYRRHDMEGTIDLGNGTVKVHDIFDPLPEFMRADCVFVDLPANGQLAAYYTKADLPHLTSDYSVFLDRVFECLKEMGAKKVFMEVFKGNYDACMARMAAMFGSVKVYESHYYHNPLRKCWILQGGDDTDYGFSGLDESDIVDEICEKVDFDVIGDPCMGQGLVGRCAIKHGRRFVGTELNKKRLGVLVEFAGGRK